MQGQAPCQARPRAATAAAGAGGQSPTDKKSRFPQIFSCKRKFEFGGFRQPRVYTPNRGCRLYI